MSEVAPPDVIVGVDTHKQTHAAVAISGLGARLAELTIAVGTKGHRELEAWACSLGSVRAFGIEGTGSYGAGLSRFLHEKGHVVREVARPDWEARHRFGKTDHLDAEGAARALLGGQAAAVPKAGTSEVEMIRHPKIARDGAVKARTQAMLAVKSIIVAAPAALREQLEATRGRKALLRHLAALRWVRPTRRWLRPRPACVPSPGAGSPSTTRSRPTMPTSSGSPGAARRRWSRRTA